MKSGNYCKRVNNYLKSKPFYMKPFKYLRNALLSVTALLPLHMQGQLVRSSAGMNLVATGDLKLVFNDAGLMNNGRFIAGNSTVLFTGSTSSTPISIGGGSPISFHHVVISRSSDVKLDNHVTVTGNITMDNGNLQLNNYTLDLGRTGSIVGEKNNARITDDDGGGLVKATAVLKAPRDVNPGNIGVSVTSTATLGETVITRGHVQQPGFYGKPAIHRYYDIAPAINSGLQATLKFYYLDAELGENNESELSVFSKSGHAGAWLAKGKDNNDASTNWVIKTNLDQLHCFTLAKAAIADNRLQNGQTGIQIFPNPSPGRFTVTVYSQEEKDAGIVLYDALGRLLERKKIHCEPGMNNIEWNISKYASGTYHLLFENLDAAGVKVVKQ
jgi:hypothetical protein